MSSERRKICVVVASRANYARIKTVLDAIKAHDRLELQLVAAASTLLERFGSSVYVMEQDGFRPDATIRLIIEGEKDHTVALAIANAAYRRQRRNPGVTEFVKVPNRGHALTIDHGWQEVAQIALDFVKRFAPAKPS